MVWFVSDSYDGAEFVARRFGRAGPFAAQDEQAPPVQEDATLGQRSEPPDHSDTGAEGLVAISEGNGLAEDSSSHRMLRTHQRWPS